MSDELIKIVCSKCRYFRKTCLFDYGDSLTKIPCEAFRILNMIELLLKGVKIGE